MTLQDQIDVIQAFKDGRTVTYISMYDCTPTRVYDRHSFDFVRNTYTVEPLYKEGEVIMVMPAVGAGLQLWHPRIFFEMGSEGALCDHFTGRVVYAKHRKQTPTEKGEA